MNGTIFLRSLAILLIIHSHSDAFYPIPQLATGGAIGNTIFFLLSSYGLYFSEQRNPRPFIPWITHRFTRIYPAVWIVLITMQIPTLFLSGDFIFDQVLEYIGLFLYPRWWFLRGLIIFYPISFFIIRGYNNRKLIIASAIGLFIYSFSYVNYLDLSSFIVEEPPFKVIFYFQIFLFGIVIARYKEKIHFRLFRDLLFLLLSVALLYSHKYLLLKEPAYLSYQFIQQIFLFPIGFYAYKASQSEFVCNYLMNIPIVSRIARSISGISLELYLVHLVIRPFFINFVNSDYGFPLNWLMFVGASFILSYIVHYLAGHLIKAITTSNSSLSKPIIEVDLPQTS